MSFRSAGLALLAAALATGCGSVSASVIDLRHDAAAVCRHTNRDFTTVTQPSSQSQDATYLLAGAARLATELRALRRIAPPRDVADIFQAALSALAHELGALRSAVTAIHEGDDPAVAYRTLQQRIAPLRSQVNNAWQALEVADCLQ
jgi:hypothetical protein